MRLLSPSGFLMLFHAAAAGLFIGQMKFMMLKNINILFNYDPDEKNENGYDFRTATARGKAEQADISAVNAREDSEVARVIARELAPDFLQPGKVFHEYFKSASSLLIKTIH